MELREYLAIARRWWWLLLLGAIIGGGAGYYFAQSKTPLYQSQTTLMIGRFIESANPNYNEAYTAQRLAQVYADLIQREPILQATVSALGLELSWSDLQGQVTARPIPDTQLLAISVTDTEPQRAMLIADEITRQLIRQSPTSEVDEEQEADRAFVRDQLAELRANIGGAQQRLQELRNALQIETTEEGVTRREAEINALQSKLDSWQSNYASLLGFSQATDTKINSLTVIEPAVMPEAPINANGRRDIALAAVVGLLLAAGVAFLLEYLDDTLKTPDDVQRDLALATLGTIPAIKSSRRQNGNGQMISTAGDFSPVAEAYRTLRTNIQFSSLLLTSAAPTLLVTSANAGEGKSTTVANLAVVIAQSAKQVILVDADLRRPVLHKIFNVPNEVGLTNLLIDRNLTLAQALQPTSISKLRVLPSGPLPPNAADMLDSRQMTDLIEQLAGQADMVIFDTPPLLAVSDASILASRVGGTLLVVETAQTRRQLCLRGKEVLNQVGVTPLGVVLNKFNPKRSTYYGYGYTNTYASGNGASGRRRQ